MNTDKQLELFGLGALMGGVLIVGATVASNAAKKGRQVTSRDGSKIMKRPAGLSDAAWSAVREGEGRIGMDKVNSIDVKETPGLLVHARTASES